MYFPYLRGRQYELIALRELIDNERLSKHVIPIIEPVKVSPTILNTINVFNDNNKEIIIVRTPSVGTFISDSVKEKNKVTFEKIQSAMNSENILSGVIINENSVYNVNNLLAQGIPYDKMVAFCLDSDNIENLKNAFNNEKPKYNIIPYSPSFRRVRNGDRIMIDDKFNKLARNNDYLSCDDEFFSDDNIYCYEDGYKGFSDYSIVGKEYSESGFAPYAVAIHIVYFASDKSLRVHHFVSDSNDDISDPANKFYEALSKLIEWNRSQHLNTLAMNTFESIYANETYPGLGVVKKLSIMHHIELVGNYLNEVLKWFFAMNVLKIYK